MINLTLTSSTGNTFDPRADKRVRAAERTIAEQRETLTPTELLVFVYRDMKKAPYWAFREELEARGFKVKKLSENGVCLLVSTKR